MLINIPGKPVLNIETIILDLNGTLAVDGILLDGVAERIVALKAKGLNLVLFTGDTNGTGTAIAKKLDIGICITANSKAKMEAAKKYNPETTAAIGNGCIDIELFEVAKLRIATLQQEGVFTALLSRTDIIVPSINDALDLFIKEKRLIATLRA